MKRIFAVTAIVMMSTAVAAIADLGTSYVEWFTGPVQHLMTTEEKERWKLVQTDQEAEAFKALFWAWRDPTPQTAQNDLREEFERRVFVADRDFTNRKTKGSMTDRGRVLILLGPPSKIGTRNPERSRSNPNINRADEWDGTVPSARGQGARQVWTYSPDRVPKFANRKEFEIVFVDEGRNDWQLATTERTNPEWILQQTLESYILSRGGGASVGAAQAATPPQSLTEFRSPALKRAYETFRAENTNAIGSTPVTWGEFVSPAGEPFVAVQLYVPAGSGVDTEGELTFFGVVEDQAGRVVEVFDPPTRLAASGTDWYVDRTLRLEPGAYNATFGLAKNDRPLAMTRSKITVRGLNPAESGISDLILSENIYPLPAAWSPTDPFTFGGLKVVPKGDSVFAPRGNLWYFFELRNPGLTDQSAPKVQVKVDIDGKTGQGPVRLALPMADAEIAKLKGTENRYAVGMAIPLESFKPGDYTMKIRVVDSVLKKNYDFERKFKVSAL